MTLPRLAFVSVSIVAAAVAVLGPAFGYEPHGALALWAFGLLAAVVTRRVSRLYPRRGTADAIIRGLIEVVAAIVLSMMVLGAAGGLQLTTSLIWFGALAAAIWWLTRDSPSPPRLAIDVPVPLIGLGAALLIFIIAFGLTHSPLTAYDSLSYHLLFPARWLQDLRLSIIATPFSDEAQAYAPANGELFFLWLMLPLHGDLLARIGQVPFLLLIMGVVYALARRAGASAAHAAWPALLCLASRPLIEQAVGADVDLICWSLFLASVYFGLIAIESEERRDWIVWGVTLGLYAGTKYVALVYAPLFLVLLVRWIAITKGRALARLAWLLPGLAIFGLPWYLRNWIVAGSPLYPASLGVAGMTIARGAYSRAAMLHSVFHTTDLRLLPPMFAHALGTTLLIGWLPLCAVGLARMLGRQPRWPAWLLAALPLVMTMLYWIGVPDNVDSRFMLPIALLALIPVSFVFSEGHGLSARRWNAAVHAACAAVFIWPLVGMNREIPAHLPWFMGGWLSLRGLVAPELLPLLALTAVIAAVAWRLSGRSIRPAIAAGAIALGSVALTLQPQLGCGAPACDYLQTTSIFLRPSLVDARQWIESHVTHATFAYAGNNVPYLLVDPHLTNRVLYVNIDRHPAWRFHDYDRAARQRVTASGAEPLAKSSGVLLPLDPGAGTGEAVRPRYERMRGDRDAWVDNLRLAGVDRLFVSTLSAYEIDYVWHDAGGFPIEETWARADPSLFTLLYENAQVRIYAVGRPQGRP